LKSWLSGLAKPQAWIAPKGSFQPLAALTCH